MTQWSRTSAGRQSDCSPQTWPSLTEVRRRRPCCAEEQPHRLCHLWNRSYLPSPEENVDLRSGWLITTPHNNRPVAFSFSYNPLSMNKCRPYNLYPPVSFSFCRCGSVLSSSPPCLESAPMTKSSQLWTFGCFLWAGESSYVS